jgi:hypothetical protein
MSLTHLTAGRIERARSPKHLEYARHHKEMKGSILVGF